MEAEQHIEKAKQYAQRADEIVDLDRRRGRLLEVERGLDQLIALGRLHAEIAHADAASTAAYFTKAREERERQW